MLADNRVCESHVAIGRLALSPLALRAQVRYHPNANTMANGYEYDLVVLGSGPAGQKGAICAAKLHKRVGIVENRWALGGVCVHSGTIPSKTLREAVLYLSGFREKTFYGQSYQLKERVVMADLTFRVDAVIKRETEVIRAQL